MKDGTPRTSEQQRRNKPMSEQSTPLSEEHLAAIEQRHTGYHAAYRQSRNRPDDLSIDDVMALLADLRATRAERDTHAAQLAAVEAERDRLQQIGCDLLWEATSATKRAREARTERDTLRSERDTYIEALANIEAHFENSGGPLPADAVKYAWNETSRVLKDWKVYRESEYRGWEDCAYEVSQEKKAAVAERDEARRQVKRLRAVIMELWDHKSHFTPGTIKRVNAILDATIPTAPAPATTPGSGAGAREELEEESKKLGQPPRDD